MTMPGDINFNSGDSYFGGNLTAFVRNGTIPEARVDDMGKAFQVLQPVDIDFAIQLPVLLRHGISSGRMLHLSLRSILTLSELMMILSMNTLMSKRIMIKLFGRLARLASFF